MCRRMRDPAYHAAAVLVSNYTVALTHAGVALWRAIGKTEAEALQALVPLLQGTVHNLHRLGPSDALTGPVARGDWPTVEKKPPSGCGKALRSTRSRTLQWHSR